MSASHQAPDDWLIAESVTPAGLRLRAALLRETGQPNDSGSTARHLELAADKIECLQDQVLGLKLLSRAQSKLARSALTSDSEVTVHRLPEYEFQKPVYGSSDDNSTTTTLPSEGRGGQ